MRHIVLIGYMGSGKTNVGEVLAQRLGRTLFDTDRMIEEAASMSINRIFETYGETRFRQMEKEILKTIALYKEPVVLSTGGGLPIQEDNRALLKTLGCVVYLKTTPDEILRRLEGDTSRPLLAGPDREAKVYEMLKKRGPVYEEAATCIVETDGKSCESIAEEIITRKG